MSGSLLGVLPELRAAEQRLRDLAFRAGLVYTVADFGGLRSQADTVRILKYRDDDYALYLRKLAPGKTPIPKNAWRPIAPWGSSFHNYGAAFDVSMVRGTLAQLGALASAAGLRWGGTFRNPDGPHFELPLTLAAAKARWEAQGNTVAPPRLGAAAPLSLTVVAAVVLILWWISR